MVWARNKKNIFGRKKIKIIKKFDKNSHKFSWFLSQKNTKKTSKNLKKKSKSGTTKPAKKTLKKFASSKQI